MRVRVVRVKQLTRAEIREYVVARVGKGKRAAGAFLVARLKETVGKQGNPLVRATPGAPPRRITGVGQASIGWRMTPTKGLSFFARAWYLMMWEKKGHPWLRKTLDRWLKEAGKIVGKDLQIKPRTLYTLDRS